MKRIIFGALIVVALVVAFSAYTLLKPPAEASAPIEAIPIEIEEATLPPATEEEAAEVERPEPKVETATAEAPGERGGSEGAAEASPTEETAPNEEPSATESEAPPVEESSAEEERSAAEASSPIIFAIDPSASQARYIINEVLRGNPTTVVGATNQVAGQFAIDPANPSTAHVGAILVNARTFATDESRRDRAVQNFILSTNQFEYITFAPTSLSGLPESAAVGETYSFQVTGDLTIRDITQPATWEVTVTPTSESQLGGTAVTTLRRSEWNLNIPSVPFVADVSEEVRLELEFTAVAQ